MYRVYLIKLLAQTSLVSVSVKIKMLKKEKLPDSQTEPQELQELQKLMDKFNVSGESEYLYYNDADTEGSVAEEVEGVNKSKPDDTSNNINTRVGNKKEDSDNIRSD